MTKRHLSTSVFLSAIALTAAACGNATGSVSAGGSPSTILSPSATATARLTSPSDPVVTSTAPPAKDCVASQLHTTLPSFAGAAAGSVYYNITIKNDGGPCNLDMAVKQLEGHTSSGDDVAIPFNTDTTDTAPTVTLQHGSTEVISIRTGTACTSPEQWAHHLYTGYTVVMQNRFRLSATVAAGKTERLYCNVTVATGAESGA